MPTKHIIYRVSELGSHNSTFQVVGYKGIAGANGTTDIEKVFAEDRWISGGWLFVEKPHWGDKVSFSIVDKDNILGLGSNVVLNTHIEEFFLRSDTQYQGMISSPYTALIPQGIYLRITYVNTSIVEATGVALNLMTHIPKDVT